MKAVLGIIDGWATAPLTWSALIRRITGVLHVTYVRQALHRYPDIAHAFSRRREELSAARPRLQATGELRTALERIERVEAENRRLTDQNDALLERFVTWAYNASLFGLDERKLDQAIPPAARS
ncbi:hypothetical protein [Caulobacter sp. BE254]|uniref:hypothetical protein n=1 Tax=Caulobacter sp. BE254 TaxID=2817720 RepID=UPI002856AAAD|nr:hypothetical protein [Caulobacter sp. BE254]MDR7114514.1 hypothetical protein [Caulobacter sp. BE254]